MPHLTYTYKLKPTKGQYKALDQILESQRKLYNECLGWVQHIWECYQTSLTHFDLLKWLTKQRQLNESWAKLPVNVQRGTLKRLDRAFRSFFRRCKVGQNPGYPRFKGQGWFKSFEFAEMDGFRLKNTKLLFKGVAGGIVVHLHRTLPKDARLCGAVLKKTCQGWEVSFKLEVNQQIKPVFLTKVVGLDVGLTTYATLSDGETVENPRIGRRYEKARRVFQRALARKQKDSNNRKKARVAVARFCKKEANTRKTWLHQTSAKLVKQYDAVFFENLNVKGMTHGNLGKSIHDASWATFLHMLQYKAARAGKVALGVDPKNTTQECSGCGSIVKKGLGDRWHSCGCGVELDRDLNAAMVILSRGMRAVVSPRVANVAGCMASVGPELSV